MKENNAPVMEVLDTYRGWVIERNPAGLIIASKTDRAFPLVVSCVESARVNIDKREDSVVCYDCGSQFLPDSPLDVYCGTCTDKRLK